MNQPTFVWTLKSKVTIVALGRTVNDLQLDKKLELSGMYHCNFAHDRTMFNSYAI